MNAQAFTRFLQVATVSDSSGQAEGLIYARAAAVPADTTAGYAKGCLLIQTDGTTNTTAYINEGTVASCVFVAMVAN